MPFQFLFGTLALPPQHPDCRLCATIPAKDEAEFIIPSLDALRLQTDEDGIPLPANQYEVLVLANNCEDATVTIIEAYQRQYPEFRLYVCERRLPASIACVGTARRLMMDTAYERFRAVGRLDGAICSTDADTLVGPNWAYHILRNVRQGARAIGGRILVPQEEDRDTHYRKQHLLDVTYRSLFYCLESIIDPSEADPWPRHFQHFGPSMAVTAEAYEKCGGIPPLNSLEDVYFVFALERADVFVTHDPQVWVRTSTRVSDRVVGTAFSHQLDAWATMERENREQRVVSFSNCVQLFKWKVALRRAYLRRSGFGCPQLEKLAARMKWSVAELHQLIRQAASFGALYQHVGGQLHADPTFSDQPITEAIAQLRSFTHSMRHRAFGKHPSGNAAADLRADEHNFAAA
ncbi:glycosyltransferase [Neolewinella antarctica]|uniref:Glycosyltransferase 2-like domain-containing protein n=1 Tax=Neolewinella antarctica TaxID=442734 RepID=A0ABX0XDG4_9BACT|nr:glycosyltransferase [Neolewinella antarctica]NJC26853.1 hypothetical protein [Neolewinella antarctica]